MFRLIVWIERKSELKKQELISFQNRGIKEEGL